jgi:hypothetical protein
MNALARIGLAPRMLKEAAAAAYCGLTVDLFKAECPVIAVKIRNRVLYDRVQIDRWLDQRAGDLTQSGADFWLSKLDDGGDATERH